jgi:hypothetical protein
MVAPSSSIQAQNTLLIDQHVSREHGAHNWQIIKAQNTWLADGQALEKAQCALLVKQRVHKKRAHAIGHALLCMF